MSLLIVAVKLCYPFDSVTRYPKTSTEPAAFNLNWETWNTIHGKVSKSSTESKGNVPEMEVTEDDVFQMDLGQMDDYMDWYQNTWLDETRHGLKTLPSQLLDMFPISKNDETPEMSLGTGVNSGPSSNTPLDRVKQVQSSLRMKEVISEKQSQPEDHPVSRPGSYYKHYRSVDEVPPDAMAFFEKAARTIALSVRSLLEAVFQTENKLRVWKDAKRKAALHAVEAGETV